jgi:zinc protease
MTVVTVSDETFEQEVLKSAEPVLVDFFAEWCGPCKAMAPALQQAAEELVGKIKVVKVDVDKSPATRDASAIRAMPTLLMFKGGKVVGRQTGALVQKSKLMEWITAASAMSDAPGEPRAEEFKLANGLHFVVVPSPGASSVTLRTLYKVGAADDFAGANMLRALLAGSPDKAQPVPAQSGMDVTTFVQSVAKNELQTAMQNDAARMSPPSIAEDDLIEVRQKATDSLKRLGMQYNLRMSAALYGAHPYAMQIGGESERIAKLSAEDLVNLHKQYFAPNNAVVVVAGPVTADEVKQLAEATYGRVAASSEVGARARPQFSAIEAGQRIAMTDARGKKGTLSRRYAVASHASGAPGEADALEVLGHIFMTQGRLVRPELREGRVDFIARPNYTGGNLAGGEFVFSATGDDLKAIETELDAIIEDIRTNGVTEVELAGAKDRLMADHASANFDAKMAAARYDAVALGVPLSRIEGRLAALSKLTTDDIRRVAGMYLDPRRAVTCVVVPDPATAEANATLAKAG